MSHRGNHGWGSLPYSNMITVSRICLYRKFTIIDILIIVCPLHPSTWNYHRPDVVGNVIWYVWGSPFGGGYPTALSLLYPLHAGYANAPPSTLPPCNHHILYTVLLSYILPVTLVPPPSSIMFTLPPTGFPLTRRGGRLYRPSSQSLSEVRLCQTTRSRCQTTSAARPGLLIQPDHNLHRKRRRDVAPTFPTLTELPLSLTPPISSDAPLRQLPH